MNKLYDVLNTMMRFLFFTLSIALILNGFVKLQLYHLAGACCCAAVLCAVRRKGKRNVKSGEGLERTVFMWNRSDPFTERDLHKSVSVYGQIGSGKSSGSGLALARGVFSLPNSGGLILSSKPEDREFWEKIAHQAGRTKDLIIFDTVNDSAFNFLAYTMKHGDSREGTQVIMTISEMITPAKDGERFWKVSKERMIWSGMESLVLAGEEPSIPNLQRFITSAALSRDQLKQPEWQSSYHNIVMGKANVGPKTEAQRSNWRLLIDYWTNEYPAMDNKPRSSILADVLNTLHNMNIGIVREKISGKSNCSPDDMMNGKWVLVDTPIDRLGESAKVIMSGWKIITQKACLRRKAKEGDSTVVIFCDEAQQVFDPEFDPLFLSRSRSHFSCMIYLVQSIHSYFSEVSGIEGQAKAKAFMTNFGHRIFHTVGDEETAIYASSLVGKYRESYISYSPKPQQTIGDAVYGQSQTGGTLSEQYEYLLKPNWVLTGLRSGGPPHFKVDGWVIKAGEPFACGENFIKVEFDQR